MLIRAQLAVRCSHAVIRICDPAAPEKPFGPGDLPEDRPNRLANRFKHYDEDVVDGLIEIRPAPIWITNNGLRCREKKGDFVDLSFVEIATLLEELRANAQFLAEDAYQQAQDRLANRDTP